MTAIGDSDAVRIDGRQLAQHQAALMVLQPRLSVPGVEQVSWLDLACGRGQILGSLTENFTDDARAKLEFFAYDVDQRYLRETIATASSLGLARVDRDVGELAKFDQIIDRDARFDFITLTNTVHEVAPRQLAGILVDALRRLDRNGTLFVYDMERIIPPELGAVPFSVNDMRTISGALLAVITDNEYRPEVGRWPHKTVKGWNVRFDREHITADEQEFDDLRETAVDATRVAITEVLTRRLAECRSMLDTLTLNGAATVDEQSDREHLLYELWAITRAMEKGR